MRDEEYALKEREAGDDAPWRGRPLRAVRDEGHGARGALWNPRSRLPSAVSLVARSAEPLHNSRSDSTKEPMEGAFQTPLGSRWRAPLKGRFPSAVSLVARSAEPAALRFRRASRRGRPAPSVFPLSAFRTGWPCSVEGIGQKAGVVSGMGGRWASRGLGTASPLLLLNG